MRAVTLLNRSEGLGFGPRRWPLVGDGGLTGEVSSTRHHHPHFQQLRVADGHDCNDCSVRGKSLTVKVCSSLVVLSLRTQPPHQKLGGVVSAMTRHPPPSGGHPTSQVARNRTTRSKRIITVKPPRRELRSRTVGEGQYTTAARLLDRREGPCGRCRAPPRRLRL